MARSYALDRRTPARVLCVHLYLALACAPPQSGRTDPGVPIWLRTIHRVGTQLGRGSEDYVRGVEQHFKPGHVNFFTDLRCHQLREMQLALARELCLPVNDVRTRSSPCKQG